MTAMNLPIGDCRRKYLNRLPVSGLVGVGASRIRGAGGDGGVAARLHSSMSCMSPAIMHELECGELLTLMIPCCGRL